MVTVDHPEVYRPAEDTMLLTNNLDVKKNEKVFEVGVGSGYVSLTAARIAKVVIGVDVNPYAVMLANHNARLNNISNVHFILGDLLNPINEKFDLIIINPPYLQEVEDLKFRFIDYSWNGGKDGNILTNRFINEVDSYIQPTGRILIVQSSLSGYRDTIDLLSKQKFCTRIIAQKRLFFETLYLIKALKNHNS